MKSYPSSNPRLSQESLSKVLHVKPEQLLIGNGASELITIIQKEFIDDFAIPVPTFSEYTEKLKKQECAHLFQLPPEKNYQLDLNEYAGWIDEHSITSALIINPGNPTGQLLSLEEMIRFLNRMQHLRLIIVDESFMDFAAEDTPSLLPHIKHHPNVIIVRSMCNIATYNNGTAQQQECGNRIFGQIGQHFVHRTIKIDLHAMAEITNSPDEITADTDDYPRVCPVERAGGLDNPLRRWLQRPEKLLRPYIKPGMTVLDLGCGPGFFTIEIARMLKGSGKVIAADLQQGMLDKVEQKIKNTELEPIVTLHRCKEKQIGLTEKADFILAFYM